VEPPVFEPAREMKIGSKKIREFEKSGEKLQRSTEEREQLLV